MDTPKEIAVDALRDVPGYLRSLAGVVGRAKEGTSETAAISPKLTLSILEFTALYIASVIAASA
jgi:hypothetical protein